jgi:hypothetical protein
VRQAEYIQLLNYEYIYDRTTTFQNYTYFSLLSNVLLCKCIKILLRVLDEIGIVICRPKYEAVRDEVRYRLIKKQELSSALFLPRHGFHSLNASN